MSQLSNFLQKLGIKRDQYHTLLTFLQVDWHTPRFYPTQEQMEKIEEIVNAHGTGFTLSRWIKEQNAMRKYGTTSVNKLKEKRQRASKTLIEKAKTKRWGSNKPGINSLSKEERQKREEEYIKSCKEKWGEDFEKLGTGEKIKITCQKNQSHLNQFEKHKERIIQEHPGYIFFQEYFQDLYFRYYLQRLNLLSTTIPTSFGTLVLKKEVENITPELYEKFKSTNSKYEEYIAEFLNQEGVHFERNNKTLLQGKELDFYIPEKHLAIEVDGNYYHSDEFLEKNYHLNKTEMCNQLGIRLIHIYDDEWREKEDLCKSIIKNALGKTSKINARECDFKPVDSKTGKEFTTQNHIQGSVNGGEYFGLYYKGELVQLIQIGKSRFKKNETELLRMCTLKGKRVTGGFSKLLSHQPFEEIYTFVDRRLFTGQGYEKTGWKELYTTPPNYFYTKNGKRENRMKFQKHKLTKLENFDSTKSEVENMLNNGYHRIYDCGTIKMKWNKER